MISVMPVLAAERSAIEALRVAPSQQGFVATNSVSLKQADAQAFCVPFSIRADEKLVGFAMYALDPDDGNYWIYRFMIAEQFQGRGYGTAALTALVERMQALPGCSSIVLGVEPANGTAARLYRRAGFLERGDKLDGETIMVRQF